MHIWIGRTVLVIWFVGILILAVANDRGVTAQGASRLHLPLIQSVIQILPEYHDYMALLFRCRSNCEQTEESGLQTGDFYTLRGDGNEWGLLVEDAPSGSRSDAGWSPNGLYFAYHRNSGGRAVWLAPLATREPRLLAEGSYALTWSPDSRYLALIGGHASEFRVYDVERDTLHQYTVPYHWPDATSIMWSPDSRKLAWTAGPQAERHDLFTWGGVGTAPTRLHAGAIWPSPLLWSPDGSRLYFTGRKPDGSYGFDVWTTDALAQPAQVLVPDYAVAGMADGGSRLVLSRDGTTYLANADGTGITLFYPCCVDYTDISASPSGEFLALGDPTLGHPAVLALVETNTGVVRGSQCYDTNARAVQWRSDDFYACDGGRPMQAIIGDPRRIWPDIHRLPGYWRARFLEPSSSLIGVDRYYLDSSPGYLHPRFKSSHLYDLNTGNSVLMQSPDHERLRVLDWRYLP